MLTGRENVARVERQAILFRGISTTQLLGVSALEEPTGVVIGRAATEHPGGIYGGK